MHLKVEQVKDFTYQKNKYKICSLRLDMGGGTAAMGVAKDKFMQSIYAKNTVLRPITVISIEDLSISSDFFF